MQSVLRKEKIQKEYSKPSYFIKKKLKNILSLLSRNKFKYREIYQRISVWAASSKMLFVEVFILLEIIHIETSNPR